MRVSILFTVAFAALLSLQSQLISAQSCPQDPATICPATPVTVPVPWFELSFETDPRLHPNVGIDNAQYSWIPFVVNDTCATYHTGVLDLRGSTQTSYGIGPYLSLNEASGPYSAGKALPRDVWIGSEGKGSPAEGTRGWSFTVSFRPTVKGDKTNWAKIVSLATSSRPNTNSVCNGEWIVGWLGGSDTFTLGTCTSNSEHKIDSFVPNTPNNEWMHLTSVIQTSRVGLSTYSIYYNGELKATREESQPLVNIYRDRADLGRSSWNDPFYNGAIDNFAIYDIALTPKMVYALYGADMAGCTVNRVPYTNMTIANDPVKPIFETDFNEDIRLAPNMTADFDWKEFDAEDTACNLTAHRGLLTLAGDADWRPSLSAGQYVNLSAASGENYIGQTFPYAFGVNSTEGDVESRTAGFTVEVSFKSSFQNPLAKVWAIGNADSLPCKPGDFWAGWRGSEYNLELMYCSGTGATRTIVSRLVPLFLRTWHHLVVSVASQPPATPNTTALATWSVYLDGQLTTVVTNQYFPTAGLRKNVLLGRSLYGGSTDTYWSGKIDRFAVYPRALSSIQAIRLAASFPAGTSSVCSQKQSTLLQLPSEAAVWSATWDIDPRPVNATMQYSWIQSDVNDTLADQQLHQGILTFGPRLGGGNPNQWVNLSTAVGPNSATNNTIGWLGGEGTGAFIDSDLGITFSLVFKILPTASTVYDPVSLLIGNMGNGQGWSKVFDFGDGNKNGGGECENDIVWGFNDRNNWMRFEVCNTINSGSSVGDGRKYQMKVKTWYHAVLTQRLTRTGPIGYIYLNGELIDSAPMGNFPLWASRQDTRLAGSSWNDPKWNGMISSFEIFSQAANQYQVDRLFAKAFNRTVVVRAPSSSSSTGVAITVTSSLQPTASSTGNVGGDDNGVSQISISAATVLLVVVAAAFM